MKVKTLVIDDEKGARETTLRLLSEFSDEIEVVGIAASVREGQEMIESLQPDLVFLDVRMSDGTGFDLLSQVKDSLNFEVIFITAFDQYAINAIRSSALDYLMKPLRPKELKEAVHKAVNKIRENHRQDLSNRELIRILIENTDKQDQKRSKLVLPDLQGFKVVEIEDIIRLEGNRNYTQFYFKDGSKSLVSKILKNYESLLEEHNFMRVHQSHIINLDFVRRYLKGSSGQVEMVDGSTVPVSRSKKDDFLDYFSS